MNYLFRFEFCCIQRWTINAHYPWVCLWCCIEYMFTMYDQTLTVLICSSKHSQCVLFLFFFLFFPFCFFFLFCCSLSSSDERLYAGIWKDLHYYMQVMNTYDLTTSDVNGYLTLQYKVVIYMNIHNGHKLDILLI